MNKIKELRKESNITVAELAKELKTFTLSTIGTFLLKMSCSTYCQMSTRRERNYHIPLTHQFVIGSILCMELTVTVQQR